MLYSNNILQIFSASVSIARIYLHEVCLADACDRFTEPTITHAVSAGGTSNSLNNRDPDDRHNSKHQHYQTPYNDLLELNAFWGLLLERFLADPDPNVEGKDGRCGVED